MQSLRKKRVDHLQKICASENIDTVMLLSDENRYYYSGFTGKDGGFEESAGILLICGENRVLVTDSRYAQQAKEEAADCSVVCYTSGLAAELPGILKDLDSRRIGFEAARMPYSRYEKIRSRLAEEGISVELTDISEVLQQIRFKKDAYEVDCIKESLTLAETVFEQFLNHALRPGMSEARAAWTLEKNLREAGAAALSFPIIAAFGANSAKPHAVCGNRRLEKHQPVLFDWGVVIRQYCSDISRSFVLGKADDTYRKVHQTVLEAQQKAIETIKPGVAAKTVDLAAREHIDKAGFEGKFGHGLGHGVGLAVHEAPRVSHRSQDILAEGMVFTVEPGIYLPGWGGVRLENMVVVENDGAEVLNRLDTDILEID